MSSVMGTKHTLNPVGHGYFSHTTTTTTITIDLKNISEHENKTCLCLTIDALKLHTYVFSLTISPLLKLPTFKVVDVVRQAIPRFKSACCAILN